MRPGLITVGLFAFLAAWNDFIAPLILISDSAKAPLPLAVANLRQQSMGAVDYGATEAGEPDGYLNTAFGHPGQQPSSMTADGEVRSSTASSPASSGRRPPMRTASTSPSSTRPVAQTEARDRLEAALHNKADGRIRPVA
ncbi:MULTISPECIES: hypothetical protein [unclassified Streptomyces]|uniref:hypothetical protein n=1 Tax=unclassified Streptomyces TaxID=2593676 RepID=UPI002E8244E6|nr:hypothetical protein [Streptomyces sp. NBC_00589]WTI42174.1 hypothetical protein OIC96_48205 [Streptomyces sp. NBC_00775]WUB24144.1 hypothetical protein OHA51_01515 [Streptomyces sp. NBC_00589]